ncbi:hypothetical protein ACH5RR_014189, partial [Cinchona calisaya]
EGHSNDRKVSALRSKHSETEQRRRSKINERFQVLRDLIPENDQRRDKASFLLEVIKYIQFLQEKIEMYKGTYQGWSPKPSKLMPWRSNSGLVENFVDQPQLIRNGSGHEDDIVVTSTFLSNSQNSIESELNGAPLYTPTDHPQGFFIIQQMAGYSSSIDNYDRVNKKMKTNDIYCVIITIHSFEEFLNAASLFSFCSYSGGRESEVLVLRGGPDVQPSGKLKNFVFYFGLRLPFKYEKLLFT